MKRVKNQYVNKKIVEEIWKMADAKIENYESAILLVEIELVELIDECYVVIKNELDGKYKR